MTIQTVQRHPTTGEVIVKEHETIQQAQLEQAKHGLLTPQGFESFRITETFKTQDGFKARLWARNRPLLVGTFHTEEEATEAIAEAILIHWTGGKK